MSQEMNCNECRQLLFEIVDGKAAAQEQALANQHIDGCAACALALSELWQLSAAATRWEERPVPHWNRRERFFERRAFFPFLQVASGFASLLVLVLVLTQAQISTKEGLTISFGQAGLTEHEVTARLDQLKLEQEAMLNARLDRVTTQQIANNQLLVSTVLEAGRQERSEDVANLLALLQDTQTQQAQRTAASLRFVLGNQIEDRRNIQQLGEALRLVASDGGTF